MIDESKLLFAINQSVPNRERKPATKIPNLLVELSNSSIQDEIDNLYWQLDNFVVVQGNLYEPAPSTVAFILSLVPVATPESKPVLLELLYQLVAGNPAEGEMPDLRARCQVEITYGVSVLFDLLRNGSDVERAFSVELLAACVDQRPELLDRFLWWCEHVVPEVENEWERSVIQEYYKAGQRLKNGDRAFIGPNSDIEFSS